MVQRSSDDDAALHGRIRDFLTRLKDVSERLSSDKEGADDRFAPLYRDFSTVLEAYGVIEIRVSTNRLSVGDDEVYRSEARTKNLAFDLFRQGIRQLKLSPGLASDELYTFIVKFSEFSSAEEIDEDLNTALWRESLPNIEVVSVDTFTEKVFMADPDFVDRFRQTIDDVMPGLLTFVESEEPVTADTSSLVDLHGFEELDRADLEARKQRKKLLDDADSLRTQFSASTDRIRLSNHLLQQLCAMALHPECPLQDAETMGVLSRVLGVYVDEGDWLALATSLRTLYELSLHRDGLSEHLNQRLERFGRVASGRDTLELIAQNIPSQETDFISWTRWFFVHARIVEAPQLLQLINVCQNPVGKELVKSLLRRQRTDSMDAWAERLRDPNENIVEEVIDLIVDSELGEQGKPLLMETLRHQSPKVRARSIEVLTPFYDSAVREAILPLITDPNERVRTAVVALARLQNDRSLTPYLIQVARSPDVFSYSEDELRGLYETTALLGDERLRELFEDRLAIGSDQGVVNRLFKGNKNRISDSPMRRAALSGLAVLGDPKSVALVRKVHSNAELSLAAHCEVVLKMGARFREQAAAEEIKPRVQNVEDDIAIGADRMGSDTLFGPDTFALGGSKLVTDTPHADTADTMTVSEQSEIASREGLEERVIRRGDELYVPGETLAHNRRLAGHPSVVTAATYRILDVQLSLMPLKQSTSVFVTPNRTATAAVETVRKPVPPSDVGVDDILRSYVESESKGEHVVPRTTQTPAEDGSVDDILKGYLAGQVVAPDTETDTEEKDLESLLIDYAEEDTKGSS